MAKMIEGDLRIPKMYNFIFTIIFDFRPKVDGVILPSPLKMLLISNGLPLLIKRLVVLQFDERYTIHALLMMSYGSFTAARLSNLFI